MVALTVSTQEKLNESMLELNRAVEVRILSVRGPRWIERRLDIVCERMYGR